MKRVRVLIVEDSAVVREHLRRIISADPRLLVVGTAASGEEAIEAVERLSPDVISMDIHLPGIQGFEATRQIMSRRPTPIVVVSGVGSEDMDLSMNALRAGALSVVEKPVASTHEGYEAVASRLCTQLALMSEVKVVRQRDIASRRSTGAQARCLPPGNVYSVLGIGASTGGPNAIAQILSSLVKDFPLPIAIVQHITPGFMGGFGEWIEDVTKFPTHIVQRRIRMQPGHVYLAPSEAHLVLDGQTADVDDGPPVGSHRPSATILFSSMARSLGSSAIGVLLTGMGDDGAAGLRTLKEAGGFTVAEAESTAVVYGMPAAAVRLGGVCESLPLGEIASRILELPVAPVERT